VGAVVGAEVGSGGEPTLAVDGATLVVRAGSVAALLAVVVAGVTAAGMLLDAEVTGAALR
jgi:hypothetical protein